MRSHVRRTRDVGGKNNAMLQNAIVYVYRYIPIERNLLTARGIVECIIIQRKLYPSAARGIDNNVGCNTFLFFV